MNFPFLPVYVKSFVDEHGFPWLSSQAGDAEPFGLFLVWASVVLQWAGFTVNGSILNSTARVCPQKASGTAPVLRLHCSLSLTGWSKPVFTSLPSNPKTVDLAFPSVLAQVHIFVRRDSCLLRHGCLWKLG